MSSGEAKTRKTAPVPTGSSADTRPAKRHRITIACSWCRQRKSRCDGSRPICSTCSAHGYECVYTTDTISLNKTSASKELLENLGLRLVALERSLASLDSRVTGIESPGLEKINANGTANGNPQEADCEPLSVSASLGLDAVDGGLIKAKDPTDGIGSMIFTKEEESGFFGPSSNIALTRQVVRTTTAILHNKASATNPESVNYAALKDFMFHASRPSSPVHGSLYLRTATRYEGDPFTLPAEDEAIRLIRQFFATTGLLFPYLDEDAFVNTYQQLASSNVRSLRRSWLALLNMVFAMATHAAHDDELSVTGIENNSRLFFQRALVLCEVDIRCASSLEIVQLLLLMSQYLQGTERSIETWNIHGLAVKAAYQLGLHSPNALMQYPQPEREFRKRTWFGCVLLDRSFSMTLGRPPSIPKSFVKLALPCSPVPLQVPEISPPETSLKTDSLQFYSATITLYTIMGEVIDVLYGNNLGCDTVDNMFDLASHLIKFEQKLLAWQRTLPATLLLVQLDDLRSTTVCQANLRLRLILTVRYLNLRILTHRPVLCKYLDILGRPRPELEQLDTLRRIGASSIHVCAESALDIISMMHEVLTATNPPRHLLGAWWFTLYYIFNASLILYATLLVQHQAVVHDQQHVVEQSILNPCHLDSAVECLSLLSKGNQMTEKCYRYASSLARTLSALRRPGDLQDILSSLDHSVNHALREPSFRSFHDDFSYEIPGVQNPSDLHMGVTLEDFFGADFSFVTSLNGHDYTEPATLDR